MYSIDEIRAAFAEVEVNEFNGDPSHCFLDDLLYALKEAKIANNSLDN